MWWLTQALDPERLRYAGGGFFGALIYGVFYVVQMVKSGQRPSVGDFVRAAVNVAAAGVVGVVSAYALGPLLVAIIPLPGLREAADPVGVGFAIGATAWELLPLAMEAARRWTGKLAGGRPGPGPAQGPSGPGEGGR